MPSQHIFRTLLHNHRHKTQHPDSRREEIYAYDAVNFNKWRLVVYYDSFNDFISKIDSLLKAVLAMDYCKTW